MVWTTRRREVENYIHPSLLIADYNNYAGTGREFEDVPNLLAQAAHQSDPNANPWGEVVADNELLKKKESNAKKKLNNHYAKKMTAELLTQHDPHGEVRSWLRAIGAALQ